MIDFKENNIREFSLPDINILFYKIPTQVYRYLLDEIEKIKSNFEAAKRSQHTLVGHIKHEYNIDYCIPEIQNHILPVAIDYSERHDLCPVILTKNLPYTIDSLWVNFQKKNEFNPPHNHRGVVSFVIWMKIPYDLKEEERVYNLKEVDQTSKFGLIYINNFGKLSSKIIPVDNTYEGVMCIFPSEMYHYVNPFYTSNDYRISISGNVFLKV